jgi:hypothetical protein
VALQFVRALSAVHFDRMFASSRDESDTRSNDGMFCMWNKVVRDKVARAQRGTHGDEKDQTASREPTVCFVSTTTIFMPILCEDIEFF